MLSPHERMDTLIGDRKAIDPPSVKAVVQMLRVSSFVQFALVAAVRSHIP